LDGEAEGERQSEKVTGPVHLQTDDGAANPNVKRRVLSADVIQGQMGKTKGLYNAEFTAGTLVRIVGRDRLEEFKRNWHHHHPLEDEQLAYGGVKAKLKGVSFYHGGDELYTLEGIPGTWNECCIED
jgi:hypothetical protein